MYHFVNGEKVYVNNFPTSATTVNYSYWIFLILIFGLVYYLTKSCVLSIAILVFVYMFMSLN